MHKHTKRKLILSIVSILLSSLCSIIVIYGWFVVNKSVGASAMGSVIDNSVNYTISDYCFYKFNSHPIAKSTDEIMMRPYDYQIETNNLTNNIFAVLELPMDRTNNEVSLNLTTKSLHVPMTMNYFPCEYDGESTFSSMANGDSTDIVYYKFDTKNISYYKDGNNYVKCSDISKISNDGKYYYYDGKQCYFAYYYLSDVVEFEIALLDITQLDELNTKETIGNLVDFTNFYHVLTDYYSNNQASLLIDSFIDSQTFTYNGDINVSFSVGDNNILNIGSDKIIYVVVNIKYSDIFNNYPFNRNIDQLFYSDLKIVLE